MGFTHWITPDYLDPIGWRTVLRKALMAGAGRAALGLAVVAVYRNPAIARQAPINAAMFILLAVGIAGAFGGVVLEKAIFTEITPRPIPCCSPCATTWRGRTRPIRPS